MSDHQWARPHNQPDAEAQPNGQRPDHGQGQGVVNPASSTVGPNDTKDTSAKPQGPTFEAPGPRGAWEGPRDANGTVWAATPTASFSNATSNFGSPTGPSAASPFGPGITATPVAATATKPQKTRKSIGRGTLVGLVALAAIIGGSAGVGVTAALNGGSLASQAIAPSATQTTTENSQGETVTKVVQGDTSAPDWTVTASAVEKSVVSIQVASSTGTSAEGSGVVMDSQGHVVTNNHVVALGGQVKVQVVMGDTVYDATIVGTDPSTDLAVLKIDNPSSDLRPIAWADSDAVVVGQPVMAVGNPLGLSGTVTTGIVSAVNRPVTTQSSETSRVGDTSGGVVVTNAIQTSAPINPGNSGGALVNANGELVGINSSIASLSSSGSSSSESGNIGIGFAIPSNQVKNIADQLVASGTAEHSYLGVSVRDGQQQSDGRTILGAEVVSVVSGSPAEKAGIKAGDLLVAIDDASVSSSEAMVGQVRDTPVNQQITITLLRDGTSVSVKATLAAQ